MNVQVVSDQKLLNCYLSGDRNAISQLIERHSRRVRDYIQMMVKDGDHVEAGTQLIEGSVDPKKILRILGPRAAQVNIVEEVHTVYRSQGVDIHDKHIEVIVSVSN